MITRLNVFIVSLFFMAASYAQTQKASFEGEVTYSNTFKSKNPKLKEKQISAMLGNIHIYGVRGGDYKTLTNGMLAQWQLFINKDNRIYNKMTTSDTLFYNNASEHYDVVISSKINKNVTTILGYLCNELVLTCKSGVHRYYYSDKFYMDSKLFVNHKYGNFYNYLSLINAVPLKSIIEDQDIIMESVATKIEAKKMQPSIFVLPAKAIVAPSLY